MTMSVPMGAADDRQGAVAGVRQRHRAKRALAALAGRISRPVGQLIKLLVADPQCGRDVLRLGAVQDQALHGTVERRQGHVGFVLGMHQPLLGLPGLGQPLFIHLAQGSDVLVTLVGNQAPAGQRRFASWHGRAETPSSPTGPPTTRRSPPRSASRWRTTGGRSAPVQAAAGTWGSRAVDSPPRGPVRVRTTTAMVTTTTTATRTTTAASPADARLAGARRAMAS